MVFAIGQNHDNLARLTFRIKRGGTQFDGGAYGGALDRYGFRADGIQEQFDGGQVQGEGGLHIGISSKNHQSRAVTIQAAHNAFYGSFGQVEPGHSQILCHHRPAHIQRNHDVHTFGFYFFEPCTRLGGQHAHGQKCDGCAPDNELPNRPSWTGMRPQCLAQFDVDML